MNAQALPESAKTRKNSPTERPHPHNGIPKSKLEPPKQKANPESACKEPYPDLFSGKDTQPTSTRKVNVRKKVKVKKNKKKFYRFHFALSDKEKLRYERLCRYEKTGFKRLVKKALKLYYEQSELHDLPMELENQLDLFSPTDLFGHPIPKRKQKK